MSRGKPLKPRLIKWFWFACFVLAAFWIGIRESDVTVSKLYYVGWPIDSNYVYPPGVEKIAFKSLDGTPLSGWFIHGRSPLDSKHPVILYVHGNAGNLAVQYSQFAFLRDWGYDVFAFDYRGFGLSEGRPNRTKLLEDTQAAFNKMAALRPGRTYGVMGFSMGAAYARLLAAQEPRIAGAVYLGGFTTFREVGAFTLERWKFPLWAADLVAWALVPNGHDPINAKGAQVLPPALFVHGTADGNIPYEMGEKMEGEYEGSKTILLMPGYGHGDYFKGPLVDSFHKALEDLFLKNNPVFKTG